MDNTVIVGILSLCGTFIGTIGGIITTQKLVNFRLQKLEEKVDKHNNIIERTFILEGKVKVIEDELKEK